AADGTDRGQKVVNPQNDTTFIQSATPSVASDSAGDFVVAFTTTNFDNVRDVYAQRFNTSGSAIGAPIRVNTDQTPIRVNTDQTPELTGPSVGSDGAGNFVVTWNTSGFNVFGI